MIKKRIKDFKVTILYAYYYLLEVIKKFFKKVLTKTKKRHIETTNLFGAYGDLEEKYGKKQDNPAQDNPEQVEVDKKDNKLVSIALIFILFGSLCFSGCLPKREVKRIDIDLNWDLPELAKYNYQ